MLILLDIAARRSLNEKQNPCPVLDKGFSYNSVCDKIRTRDLLVRSQTLYPAELHTHDVADLTTSNIVYSNISHDKCQVTYVKDNDTYVKIIIRVSMSFAEPPCSTIFSSSFYHGDSPGGNLYFIFRYMYLFTSCFQLGA